MDDIRKAVKHLKREMQKANSYALGKSEGLFVFCRFKLPKTALLSGLLSFRSGQKSIVFDAGGTNKEEYRFANIPPQPSQTW